MAQFIFTNLLLLALGTILYLSVRALPRLGEPENAGRKRNLVERWIISDIPHRLDATLNVYAGKLLRKLKIWLLRLDNLLTNRLRRMSEGRTANNQSQKVDFSEITGEKGEGKVDNS